MAEESEGWIRLRTVTAEWNSDEEGNPPVQDLRNKLKACDEHMHALHTNAHTDAHTHTHTYTRTHTHSHTHAHVRLVRHDTDWCSLFATFDDVLFSPL